MKSLPAIVVGAVISLGAAHPARLDVGIDEHVGARVPVDLELTDTTGARVTLDHVLDGRRPVVLVMAYARCTMLCSVVLRGITQAITRMDLAPGRDYLPVVVSLDPHETPDEAARRQNKLLVDIGHAEERSAWPYFVGTEPNIAQLARALGFRYAWDPDTKQYAHPAVVFVLTPDGRIAEYVRGVTFDGIAAAIQRAKRGEITSSVSRDLLACFHFDPSLRRYESKIALLFRLGAGVVLLTLTGLIGALVVWERRRRS
jgi:protein SCO1/2